MEGDMKDIVLERLEQRLKEKDEEIRGLKKELQASSDRPANAETKGLGDKVDHLETEVRETQITLSEVMKKVGALEGALNSMLMSMADGGEDGYSEEGLPGAGGMHIDSQPFDKFAADADRKDIMEDGHEDKDALRFFHLGKNT